MIISKNRIFVYSKFICLLVALFLNTECIKKHPVHITSKSIEESKKRGFFLNEYDYSFESYIQDVELNEIDIFSEYVYFGDVGRNEFFTNEKLSKHVVVSLEKCSNLICVNLHRCKYNGNQYEVVLDSCENDSVVHYTLLVCLKTRFDSVSWPDRYRSFDKYQGLLYDEIPIGVLKFYKK